MNRPGTPQRQIGGEPAPYPGARSLLFIAGDETRLRDTPLPGSRLRSDQVVTLTSLHRQVADDVWGGVVQVPGTVRDLDGDLYAVPVRLTGRIAGSVLVLADHSLTLAEQEALLAAIAEHALEIVLCSSEHRARLDIEVTDAIGEISRSVARSAQLPTVVPAMASVAASALGFTRASILLLDGEDRLGVAASQYAGGQPDVRVWGALRSMVPLPEAFGRTLGMHSPMVFAEPESAAALAPQAWVRQFGIKTVVLAPIRLDDRPLGLIVLDDERRRAVADEDLGHVTRIARAAGHALATIDLLQDERAALHRSQLVLGTVVQAATQLNTAGVLTVI
ncbi:MAG: GAF domain-containing protein, partial [Actinobacteria bacterium]